MASPEPKSDYELLLERFRKGEISVEDFSSGLDSLPVVPPPPPPISTNIPSNQTDIQGTRFRLINQRTLDYMKQAGLSEEEASWRAMEEVNQMLAQPATSEFTDMVPPSMVSRIRDAERGIVYDPETMQERKGTAAELFLESFKPQVIAEGAQFELMQERRRRALAMDEQDFVDLERETAKRYVEEEGIGEEEAKEAAKKIAQEMRDFKESIQTKERIEEIYQKGRSSLPLGPVSIALPKATSLFTLPLEETGQLVETPLATAFRYLNIAPAAVSAAVSEYGGAPSQQMPVRPSPLVASVRSAITGESEEDILAEMQERYEGEEKQYSSRLPLVAEEKYKKSKEEGFVDQFLVNMAKGQGVPSLVEGTEPVADFLVSAGGEYAPLAFGIGAELLIPVTGIGTMARLGSKAIGAAGRTVSSVSPEAGRAMLAMSRPIDYSRFKANTMVIDEMLESTGTGQSSAKILKSLDETPWASPERWEKALDSSSVQRVAADAISEHINTISMLKSMKEQGELTEKAIRSLPWTPTTGQFRSLAYPTILKGAEDTTPVPMFYHRGGTAVQDAPITMNQYASRWIDRQYNLIQSAARKNPALAKVANQGETAALFATQASKGVPVARSLSGFGVRFEDALLKAKLARLTASGALEADEVIKILKGITKAGRTDIGPAVKSFLKNKNLSEDLWDAPFRQRQDVMAAANDVGAASLQDSLLNMMPADMVFVGRNTIAPKASLKDKAKMKAFTEETSKAFKPTRLVYSAEDGVHKIRNTLHRRVLADIFVRETGLESVQRSPLLQQTLEAIMKGELSSKQMKLLEQSVVADAAKKHLDGVDMLTGGEQMRRAVVPEELISGAIGTKASSFAERAPASLGITASDMVQSLKIISSGKIPYFSVTPAKFLEDFAAVETPPAWHQFQVTASNVMDSVMPMLKEDLKAAKKATGNANFAFNRVAESVWTEQKLRLVTQKEQVVADLFNGDWKKYAEVYLPDKMRSIKYDTRQAYRTIAQADSEAAAKAAYPQIWKDTVLDYSLFADKLDSWEAIAKAFYGSNTIEAFKKAQKTNFANYMRINPSWADRMGSSRASHVLPFTLENLKLFDSRVLERAPQIFRKKGKDIGLKTLVSGKKAYPVAFLDWMLGTRRGEAFRRAFDDFYQSNPAYTIDLSPVPNAPYASLDLPVLKEAYGRFADRVLTTFSQSDVTLKDPAAFRSSFVDTMAEKHIQAVQATTSNQRAKILSDINSGIGSAQTLDIAFDKLAGQIYKELQVPFDILKKQISSSVGRRLDTAGVPEVRQQILMDGLTDDLNRLFAGIDETDNPFVVPVYSAAGELIRHVKEAYRSYGLTVGESIINSTRTQAPTFVDLKHSTRTMVLSAEEAELLSKMLDETNSLRLQTTLDALQAKDKGLGAWIGSILSSFVTVGRRNATTALLGGFPGPNTRYLGVNILTAPVIMATSVGLRRLGLAANEAYTALKLPFLSDSTTVFTSATGRKWTAGEVKATLNRTNIGFTRGSIEFSEAVADEMLGLAGMSVTGAPKIAGRKIDLVTPWKKNIFAIAADESDNFFRRTVFLSALKEGQNVEQASILARRSMLDYGSVPQWEKDTIGKWTLFYAFRRSMFTETMNALYRGMTSKAGPGFVAGSARASMRQQQAMETWLNGDDSTRTRMYSTFKAEYDTIEAGNFGPANPAVETFANMISIFTGVAGSMQPGYRLRLLDSLKDMQFTPAINTIIELIDIGTREGQTPGRVPADFVYFCKATGQWDDLKNMFGIVPLEEVKRKPGAETYGQQAQQYRFKNQNYKMMYAGWQLASLYLGIRRNITDYPKVMMAAGVQPEDLLGEEGQTIDPKRYGQVNPMLYMLGAETGLNLVNYELELSRKDKQIVRKMQDLLQEENTQRKSR